MIIYPAIDLRGGQVVRLQGGDPNAQTTFSTDPLATAQKWCEAGATWLHMVNLDGAFGDKNTNLDVLTQVAQTDLSIQFGGGIRSLDDIETALKRGAKRVV
ncbi:MAG: 1-(5-phosphoribosyl)-5-[(5-phosphoribosylamino)methylideneamino]imidazole-4-carboxamide isomerase, partial [Anaerolineae bacterium]|nr:1-(5-phosphoribosyl)-5-[(5-phosphoribosylamino)methylideneamino]imidazole-4-carboxamide isomerase [Anaerolineae bacterium]